MSLPQVTVICLCYNQAKFVKQAVLSVLAQSYSNVELVVVDDASNDNSRQVIGELVSLHPQISFISLSKNSGNCKAFNLALRKSQGEYIIDLAADDILLPDRVARGVDALQQSGDRFGVNFTDAGWISEDGRHLYRHSDRFPHSTVPQGDIYEDLIERFFICSPTMMFRRRVIDSLGGYDESLAYEDFDFWVRSSRQFLYCYTPEVLVKKRIVKGSMSQRQFRILSPQLKSTFKVCEKIMALNQSQGEQDALARRIFYELKFCMRLLNLPLAFAYAALYLKNRRLRYHNR
jgi:glycosyltransferase involved in cell wall biosynthesis